MWIRSGSRGVEVCSLGSERGRWALVLLLYHKLLLLLVGELASASWVVCLSIFLGWLVVNKGIILRFRVLFVFRLPLFGLLSVFGSVSRSWPSPISWVIWVRGRSLWPRGPVFGALHRALHGCIRGLITPFVSEVLLFNHFRWLDRRRCLLFNYNRWRD